METKQTNILGVQVDQLTRQEVEGIIAKRVAEKKEKPLFLVTAYSEFFLEAQKNVKFSRALRQADYILPDGVSVLEAMDYLSLQKSSMPTEFMRGMKVGFNTLRGKYTSRASGITLVRKLLEDRKYKIFLLGGWNGVAEKLGKKYTCGFLQGPASVIHTSKEENKQILEAISTYKPDILLVSFGRFNQEIWIAEHLNQLSAKVVIGVGSAFDEILGEGKWAKKVPAWVDRMGLKWLWRVGIDRGQLKRLIHIPQFAWAVFMQKISS